MRIKEKHIPILFLLPCIVTLLAITIFPLVYSLSISLTNYELGRPIELRFVGLENYWTILFEDSRFLIAISNTFIFVASTITIQFFFGLALALVLNRSFKGRSFIVAVVLLPMMIVPVATGYIWWMLYDVSYGPFNYILEVAKLTTHEAPVKWLADPSLSLLCVIVTDCWQYTPFMMLVLLAGLQSIPVEPYEAAQIDGAGRWQTFRHITLPLLRSAIAVAILIRTIDAFKIFDLVYLMTYGGPGTSSEVASFYTYLNGFRFFRMGYASALSYIILLIVTLFTTIFLRFLRRVER